MSECAAEVHLRALADCIRHPERYDTSPRSLADAVSPEGSPPMLAHPPANRWAAFTDDELEAIDTAVQHDAAGIPKAVFTKLMDEIWAELERRKGMTGPERRCVWLAPDGDDRNDGTRQRPLRSFAAAYALLPDGGTVRLEKGTYRYVSAADAPPEGVSLVGLPNAAKHTILDMSERRWEASS